MKDNNDILLELKNVSKKFCKDIKYNALYGSLDIVKKVLGNQKPSHKLRKHEFWAVKDFNLTLRRGQILGLLGHNGSGKTTLMRLIYEIYPLTSGKMIKHGRVVGIFSLRAGMQSLYTGRENVFIKGSMYGMSRKEIEEKFDQIVDFAELGEFIDVPLGNYSSGMRARLAYSIVVHSNFDILLIDEALAVGDTAFKIKCMKQIMEFSKTKAIIYITHHINRLTNLATDIIVIDKGVKILETSDIQVGIDKYLEGRVSLEDEDLVV